MTEEDHTDPLEPLTVRQEIRVLSQIVSRVERLTPAGRRWLKSWIEGAS